MDKIEEQLLLKKYSKLLKLYFLSRTVFAKFSFKYRFVEYFFLKKKNTGERPGNEVPVPDTVTSQKLHPCINCDLQLFILVGSPKLHSQAVTGNKLCGPVQPLCLHHCLQTRQNCSPERALDTSTSEIIHRSRNLHRKSRRHLLGKTVAVFSPCLFGLL